MRMWKLVQVCGCESKWIWSITAQLISIEKIVCRLIFATDINYCVLIQTLPMGYKLGCIMHTQWMLPKKWLTLAYLELHVKISTLMLLMHHKNSHRYIFHCHSQSDLMTSFGYLWSYALKGNRTMVYVHLCDVSLNRCQWCHISFLGTKSFYFSLGHVLCFHSIKWFIFKQTRSNLPTLVTLL